MPFNDKERVVTVIDAVRNAIIKKIENLPYGMELPNYNPRRDDETNHVIYTGNQQQGWPG